MTNEQFEELVFKLEAQARSNPSAYQRRVLWLAWLGNFYLGAIVVLLVLLFLGSLASVMILKAFAVKLILIVGCFVLAVIKAMWVKVAPPAGTEVYARNVPALFEMIHDLQRKLGTVRFHHVLITDEFNAGVCQIPRLGIFGWDCNYLVIGLPLMKWLSVDQFKAILAHEFGHLAKGHGRMANWLYRQRKRWFQLLQTLERQGKGSFLFKPFLQWYGPYFNAYSFPLARADEYEADATSARLTTARAAAEALTNVSVVANYLSERYWPHIHKQADHVPQPNFAPYSNMRGHIASEMDEEATKTWLEQSLTTKTTCADTHPALSDRLAAIGEKAQLALPETGQAADQLLGDSLAEITEALDAQWKSRILPAWEKRHCEVREGRSRLEELNARHCGGEEFSIQDALERAKLTESAADNPDDALAQFRVLYERAPEDAVVCYNLGVRLLMRDDSAGFELIERTMELDGSAKTPCCELLRDYCWSRGRKEEAELWHKRAAEHVQATN